MKKDNSLKLSKHSHKDLPPLRPKSTESSARLPWDYSHPVLKAEGAEHFQMIYSTEVNLTIRLKVKEFTRKQATLLVGQSLYSVLTEGISLGDWMILEFLYSYLLGSKQYPTQVKNPKEFELLLLLKIVLLSGAWLDLEDKVLLPEDIQNLLKSSKWIPNKRTFYSRKASFQMNKFLQVRIVPVDTLIERSKGNERYSSYCKGYGESSHMGRRQKTRTSAELDGVPVDFDKENVVLIPNDLVPLVLQTLQLERKYKPKKKKIV
jgi:hypothetical protein